MIMETGGRQKSDQAQKPAGRAGGRRNPPRKLSIVRTPFPPSLNKYYRPIRFRDSTKVLLTKQAREFRRQVGLVVLQLNPITPHDSELAVLVDLYPPDDRVRDADNYLKGLFDALTKAGVWTDDRLVKRPFVTMHRKSDTPTASIRILPLTEEIKTEMDAAIRGFFCD